MHIGLVGLGKMGANMRTRIRAAGIEVTGYDRNPDVTDVPSLEALVEALPAGERVVWVMVPSGVITDGVVTELAGLLTRGDILIDGGNSYYQDDQKHADVLAQTGVDFLDAGVSGGVWGLENGYGLMVGGDAAVVAKVMPVFDALRPEGPREEGFVHAGTVGAGHFAKMVHNGIEYGLMQSYAEGYELLAAKDLVTDVHGTMRAWQRGTVVRSWLLELLVKALGQDGPGRDRRLGRGLRRGSVDRRRGDRPGRAGTGDLGGPVRAVPVPPGGVPGDEGRRGAASAVRRARGQAGGHHGPVTGTPPSQSL